jgi:hypothetical protein
MRQGSLKLVIPGHGRHRPSSWPESSTVRVAASTLTALAEPGRSISCSSYQLAGLIRQPSNGTTWAYLVLAKGLSVLLGQAGTCVQAMPRSTATCRSSP